MIDIANLFTPIQIADSILGGKVSRHTVRRWIARGVGTPKVKLKAGRLGGQLVIHRADLEEFLEATTDPALYRRQQKSKRVAKAKRRLEKAGC